MGSSWIKRLRNLIVPVSVIFLLLFFFENCGIEQPRVVSSLSRVGFYHAGSEESCSSCHESGRPTNTTVFLATLDPNKPFDYSTHGIGFDCISCHNVLKEGVRSKRDWANGHFTHTVTLTSCSGCHLSQRPGNSTADLLITNGFDHTKVGNTDCFACHQSSFSTAFSKLKDWQSGQAMPATLQWNTTNDIQLSSLIPTYSSTSISNVSAQTLTLHMTMNHNNSHLTSNQMGSCTLCHSSVTDLSALPITFHSAMTSANLGQPKTCSECHDNTVLPAGFVGPLDSGRSPATAAMKHNAVAWLKTGGAWNQGTTSLLTNDCSSCHVAPTSSTPATGNGWNGAFYHSRISTQPSSCLDCHANSRPTGTTSGILTHFNHSTIPAGMGDCVSCHTSTNTWRGGIFHNNTINASLTSCNSCHESQRPTSFNAIAANGSSTPFVGYDAVVKPFDLASHGDGLECNVCHSPNSYTAMSSWSGGQFHKTANPASSLTSCWGCHSSQRPTVLGPNAFIATTFDHANSGQGDCIACHMATVKGGTINGVVVAPSTFSNYKTSSGNATSGFPKWGDSDWKGGVSVPTGLAGPDSTYTEPTLPGVLLNSDSLPIGQISATLNTKINLLDQMLHSSTNIPSSYWTGGVVGSTLSDSQCVGCHAGLPTKYAGGRFHTAPGVVAANLTSCKECHTNTNPTTSTHYIVGGSPSPSTRPMNHWATLTGGTVGPTDVTTALDCIKCHSKTAAGSSFSGGTFHANLTNTTGYPSNCTTCHYQTLPPAGSLSGSYAANTFINGLRHTSSFVSSNCKTCHVFNSSSEAANNTAIGATAVASASWNNGKYHSVTSPTSITSCSDCHSTKPTTLSSSGYSYSVSVFAISNSASGTPATMAQHMNHTTSNLSADCVSCHNSTSGDLTAGVTPTSWSKTTIYHNTYPSPGTCKECHGLSNGGGSLAGTNNDIPSAFTASITLTTSSVAPANTYDMISHTLTEVSSLDCNVCHSTVGMTANGGKRWKDATFHQRFSSNASITSRCDTCHANITPAAGQTAQDHTALAGADCASCHNYPGLGAVGNANWKGASGAANHTATASCVSCHNFNATTNVYTFKDPTTTTDNRLNVSKTVTFNYPMTGTAKVLGTYTHTTGNSVSYDCKSCHVNVATASGTTITINSTHLPPSSGAVRTFWKGSTNWYHASVFGKPGQTDIIYTQSIPARLGTTQTCGDCHSFNPSNIPAANKNGANLHSSSYGAIVNRQCGLCHGIAGSGAPYTTWKASYGGENYAHRFRNLYGGQCTQCHPNGWN